MNKKIFQSIFWGLFIIAIGAVLALKAMGVDINLFFPGWWTMFIIVPCIYWIIKNGPDVVNLAGLIIGVLFLLENTELFGKYISWKLIFPIIIVVIGVNIIISAFRKNGKKGEKLPEHVNFEERTVNFSGKEFTGGTFKCTCGSLTIDLTGAEIKQEKPLAVECSFGEVTVVLPAGVMLDVKSDVNCGKVDTLYASEEGGTSLDMQVACSFGSVTVK